jgi:hypothetical protein
VSRRRQRPRLLLANEGLDDQHRQGDERGWYVDALPAGRWLSRFNGLRGRMAVLLLAVLLLPTGYAVVHAIDQYRHQGEQQQRELQRTARLIADHQATMLGNLQTWLEQNARVETMPVVGPLCNDTLADKRAETPLVTRLSLVAPSGRIMCSAEPPRSRDRCRRELLVSAGEPRQPVHGE